MGLLCAAVARSSGYGNIVMADIIQNRLDFALGNGFADKVVKLPSRRAQDTEQGLVFAKEDAINLQKENDGKTFSRSFECTGVESCVRTSIYVSTRFPTFVSQAQEWLLTITNRQHATAERYSSLVWAHRFRLYHFPLRLYEKLI